MKFLVLYRSGPDARTQLAAQTHEQMQAGARAWASWFDKAGDVVLDRGSPLIDRSGSIGGFSILQAESSQALTELLSTHPHHWIGTIDVHEYLSPAHDH